MRHTSTTWRPWTTVALFALALGGSLLGAQEAAPPPPPAKDPSAQVAEQQPLAAKALVLDLANGTDRAIAVGERGHILVSETRSDWRQVENVPTRSTLTAVTAIGDQAWAVGHDGVILHTADGGLTWQSQRAAPYNPMLDDLHNGTPLLDVLFTDASNGFAIGAYSQVLRTTDGGATWNEFDFHAAQERASAPDDAATVVDEVADGEAVDGEATDADGAEAGVDEEAESWTFSDEDLALEDEADPHLNAIARTGDGSFLIVGERGVAFRSTDGGETWQRLALPYKGSMFGVIGYDNRHVLAFGLRGHVFESIDLGDNWQEVETGTDLSLMGGVGWSGGGAALVGANGVVLTRSAANSGLLPHVHPDGAVLAAVLPLVPGGELVVGGENGVSLYQPN